ncbi:MAG: S41 family peptidase [Planctomycetota bacterium]
MRTLLEIFALAPVSPLCPRSLLLAIAPFAHALPYAAPQDPPTSLSEQDRREVVAEVNARLAEHYVFAEQAERLTAYLEAQLASGAYRGLDDPEAFATRLTEDLRSVNGDMHLNVYVTPEDPPAASGDYDEAMWRARGPGENYGFSEARLLAGNVGYLRMSSFSFDELYEPASEAAARAMAFLSHADALILDLRGNPGGGARLIRFLSSYFFGPEPVHLNDYYFRSSDRTLAYWTLEELPGERRPDVPLYILVDRDTFSAAEGFAYNLKHLGRAVIVGQTTAGGSHGGAVFSATEGFRAFIPFSRSIHPVTGTDFEGVGVLPDVPTDSVRALELAHRGALETLLADSPKPDRERELAALLESFREPPRAQIESRSQRFSTALVAGDLDALMNVYATGAILAPPGRERIEGRDAIREFWQRPEEARYLEHETISTGLWIRGETAYDLGVYRGAAASPNGTVRFAGGYLLVWERDVAGRWRIVLDI